MILEHVKYAIYAVFEHLKLRNGFFKLMAENSIMQHILVFPYGTCACEIIYTGTWYQKHL